MLQLLELAIVSHERPRLLRRCVASVIRALGHCAFDMRVVIYNSSAFPAAGQLEANVEERHVPSARTVCAKRDLAVRESKADWIVFVDDDCEITLEALGKIVNLVQTSPANVAAYFFITRFVGEKMFWYRCVENTDFQTDFAASATISELPWAPTSLAIFQTTCARQVGSFASDMDIPAGGEDVEICLKLRRAGFVLRGVPEELVLHTTETWNTFRANAARSANYGRAQLELLMRWPHYGVIDFSSAALFLTAGFVVLALFAPRALLAGVAGLFAGVYFAELLIQAMTYPRPFVQILGLTALRLCYQWGYYSRAFHRGRLRELFKTFDWRYAWTLEKERGRKWTREVFLKWSFGLLFLGLAVLLARWLKV